jgi:hypothetical protein
MVRSCQNGAICGEQQSWWRRDLTHTVSSASTRLVPIIPEGPLLSQPTTYSPFSMAVPSVPWPLLNTRPFAFGTRPVKTKWNDKHQHHYHTTRALFGPFSCMPGNINSSINCSLSCDQQFLLVKITLVWLSGAHLDNHQMIVQELTVTYTQCSSIPSWQKSKQQNRLVRLDVCIRIESTEHTDNNTKIL